MTSLAVCALRLLRIQETATSTRVDIEIVGPHLRATPSLVASLLRSYPTLAQHACYSRGSGLFGDKITAALLPHVLEHLAIELLVQAHPGHVFAGNTAWLNREHRTMRVRLSHQEGADVEAVVKEALVLMNSLLAA